MASDSAAWCPMLAAVLVAGAYGATFDGRHCGDPTR